MHLIACVRCALVPVEFLSDEEAAAHGAFVGVPSQAELERWCFLDDADLALVNRRRVDHLRLRFALQLVTARALGTFLVDPLDVPTAVLDYVAVQLEVDDPSSEHDPAREAAWIAEVDGRRVGCVFCIAGDEDATAKLRILLVDPAGRGQGVGRRLVEQCLEFARKAGYRRITLWTNDVLVSARRIYQARRVRARRAGGPPQLRARPRRAELVPGAVGGAVGAGPGEIATKDRAHGRHPAVRPSSPVTTASRKVARPSPGPV